MGLHRSLKIVYCLAHVTKVEYCFEWTFRNYFTGSLISSAAKFIYFGMVGQLDRLNRLIAIDVLCTLIGWHNGRDVGDPKMEKSTA